MICNNKKSCCCGCYFLGRQRDSNSFRSRSLAAVLFVVLQMPQGTAQVGQSSFANLETKATDTSCKNDYFVEVEGQRWEICLHYAHLQLFSCPESVCSGCNFCSQLCQLEMSPIWRSTRYGILCSVLWGAFSNALKC